MHKIMFTLAAMLAAAGTPAFAQGDLAARLRSADPLARSKAAQAVYESERIPDDLLPVLFEVMLAPSKGSLKEQVVANVAVHYANLSVARFGSAAIPRLRELARAPETRWKAIGVINRIGDQAADALPEIVECIGDQNENVRSLAIRTVIKLGPRAAAAVDALIHAMEDTREDNREAAIQALGSIGPAAKKAVPELKKRLRSSDVMVPSYAEEALKKIRA
jgi:HEAT repeat protein